MLLVAVIIAGHGALAYGTWKNAWPYQDVQEVQLGAVSNVALSMVVLLGALFSMGLFFLMSGLVTPGSVSRKGTRNFARDRLIRLGVPLAVWTLFIWPGAIWAAHLAAGDTHSFWSQLTHQAHPRYGPYVVRGGPAYLLARIRGLASWSGRGVADGDRRRPRAASRCPGVRSRPLPWASRSLRSSSARFPAASGQIGQSHLWQWPQFLPMFVWASSPPSTVGSNRCQTGFAAVADVPRWAGSRRF